MYTIALDKVYQTKWHSLMWVIFMPDQFSQAEEHWGTSSPMWYCSCYLWGLQLSHLIDLYVLYMFYKMCEWFIHTLQGCRMCIIRQSKKTALTDVNEIFLFLLVWVSPENKLHDAWFVHNHCIKRKSKLLSNDLFYNLIFWNLCS